jgi:DNA-binding protein H-NS
MATSKGSFAEIQKRIRDAEKQLEEDRQLAASMKEEELKSFVEDWLSRAESLGFSVVDVVEAIRPHFPSSLAKKGGPRKARANSGKKAEPKYRDPKSGMTWTGRGRPAAWMQTQLDAGKKKEDFLISK